MENCSLGPEDHVWRRARAAAVARDRGTCQACGRGPTAQAAVEEEITQELGVLFVDPPLLPMHLLERWLRWRALPVEVHHVQPVEGRRGQGCQHHRSGLVTLCRPCHALVTGGAALLTAPTMDHTGEFWPVLAA